MYSAEAKELYLLIHNRINNVEACNSCLRFSPLVLNRISGVSVSFFRSISQQHQI